MLHFIGVKSSTHRHFLPMTDSARLYTCLRCNGLVLICSRCDRGNRYCLTGCSEVARQDSLNRAAKKYAASRQGQLNNAARQKRHRERKQKKVTHQCSEPVAPRVVVVIPKKPRNETPKMLKSIQFDRCHQCGCQCSPYFRRDFLHRTGFSTKRSVIWP